MPYLVRIGRIDQNVSGVGSRGYAVVRTGRKVIVKFGKVEAVGGGTTRFYWVGTPARKPTTCRTIQEARVLARELVRRQRLANGKGSYHKLPAGVRIYSSSSKPKSS